MGYTKLFREIITSTIWQEPNDCRVLWITLLALRERDNIARASIPGLAHICNISIADVEKYLAKLEGPDPYSRSKDHDGRRIQQVDGGWLILNAEKYRDSMSQDERREYNRVWMRQYRAKNNPVDQNVDKCGHQTLQVEQSESESEKELYKPPIVPLAGGRDAFEEFWKAYPRKVGKLAAKRAWKNAKINGQLQVVLDALEKQRQSDQWKKDGGQFIPHPSTWINQGRWMDTVGAEAAPPRRIPICVLCGRKLMGGSVTSQNGPICFDCHGKPGKN